MPRRLPGRRCTRHRQSARSGQKTINDGLGPWRASRDIEVNGKNLVHAPRYGVGIGKKTPAAGAGTHGDYQLGSGVAS